MSCKGRNLKQERMFHPKVELTLLFLISLQENIELKLLFELFNKLKLESDRQM